MGTCLAKQNFKMLYFLSALSSMPKGARNLGIIRSVYTSRFETPIALSLLRT
jgi:hypothetical protein